jgi:hypothetical protein
VVRIKILELTAREVWDYDDSYEIYRKTSDTDWQEVTTEEYEALKIWVQAQNYRYKKYILIKEEDVKNIDVSVYLEQAKALREQTKIREEKAKAKEAAKEKKRQRDEIKKKENAEKERRKLYEELRAMYSTGQQ